MASPVFVIDVRGQPLMPVAPAHARKLLAGGRAEQVPHSTLTIIRLNRQVDQPKVRPVLVGMVTHAESRTTELFFLAAGTSAIFPSLYVVLTQAPFSTIDSSSHHNTDLIPNHSDPIAAVLDSLRRFLPISLIVFMQSSSQVSDGLRDWLSQSGIQEMGQKSVEHSHDTVLKLYAALTEFVADPQRAAQTLVAVPRPYTSNRFLASGISPTIGVVEDLDVVGLLNDADATENKNPIIQIAVAASSEGVSWKSLMIPKSMSVRQWSGRGAAIIPVVQLSQATHSLVLW